MYYRAKKHEHYEPTSLILYSDIGKSCGNLKEDIRFDR